MTDVVDQSAFTLPERVIPIPRSLSPEARAALEAAAATPRTPFPDPADDDGWRAHVATQRGVELQYVPPGSAAAYARQIGVRLDIRDVGGVPVDIAAPDGWAADDRRAVLFLHGGAWMQGGGEMAMMMAIVEASNLGLPCWGVDYRMLPEHPFPAHLDDCLTAYRAIIEEHGASHVAVTGMSAGGNLAAALVLRVRDEGLEPPAAVAMWTPSVDLTRDGDTWHTLDGLDPIIGQHMGTAMDYYARGHDPKHPYLSPLFGELAGFPPAILVSGTRDGLLSDTVRFHRALRRAGVSAELHVFEGMPHIGFPSMTAVSPEDLERNAEIRGFIHSHLTTKERAR